MSFVKTRIIKYQKGVVTAHSYNPAISKGHSCGDRSRPTPREEQSDEQKEANAKRSARRSRKLLRNAIMANYTKDNSRFVTLTFRENVKDIDKAMREFGNFIKRLKYYQKKHYNVTDLKYCGSLERQKRGAWHFHLLVNKYIKHSELEHIWDNGFVKINMPDDGFSDIVHLANYVAKYITKDMWDYEQLKNRKKVLKSKNLVDPEVIDNPTLKQIKKYLDVVDDFTSLRDLTHYIAYESKKVVPEVGVFKTIFFLTSDKP